MVLKLACLYLAVTCVFAAPPTDVVPLEKQQPTVIPIVSQSEELEANGTFKYSYETGNGIKREETSYDKVLPKGKIAPTSNEAGEESDESNEIHVQQGSYSYTAPDGTVISVRYIADENGFRPVGDHLPKPPSVVPVSSGRRAKTLDTTAGGSAPALATVDAPETPQAPKAPNTPAPETPQAPESPHAPAPQAPAAPEASEVPQAPKSPAVESRLSDTSAEQASTTVASQSTDSSTTPEASATVAASTTEIDASTTEQASSSEVSATEPSTTTEAATPPSSPEPSTSELTSEATTSPESLSTSAAAPTTTQELVSSPSEEASTPAASTAAIPEVTEVATTVSA